VYILCGHCNDRIKVRRVGVYACLHCGTKTEAKIGDVFSNVRPIVFYNYTLLLSFCISLLLSLLFKWSVDDCINIMIISFMLLSALETFHLGIARSMIGVFYREDNPLFVNLFAAFMLLSSLIIFLATSLN